MFTVGQQCTYRPNGSTCRIDKVFGERHRLRITLDNGQEVDEVAFHDVETLPETPTPNTSPSPAASVEASGEAEEPQEPSQGLQTPESFRRRLRGY